MILPNQILSVMEFNFKDIHFRYTNIIYDLYVPDILEYPGEICVENITNVGMVEMIDFNGIDSIRIPTDGRFYFWLIDQSEFLHVIDDILDQAARKNYQIDGICYYERDMNPLDMPHQIDRTCMKCGHGFCGDHMNEDNNLCITCDKGVYSD